MPCRHRVEYPGAIYHVMSRANGKENIFETEVDRLNFVKSLAETYTKTGFQMHAYCLTENPSIWWLKHPTGIWQLG